MCDVSKCKYVVLLFNCSVTVFSGIFQIVRYILIYSCPHREKCRGKFIFSSFFKWVRLMKFRILVLFAESGLLCFVLIF